MKDLFLGSLGRLKNHGGSRMFTTPNTISVPQEYAVETDVPSVAEFVTCSLDGRLWVWKRSRRYYVAAFRWDNDTQRLTFAQTIVLNNLNIIGRGINWILSDTVIIQASDDEPYIVTANLCESNGTTSLYSAVRSKVFALQTVSKHYSFLPTVGDWHIVKNFLLRNPDNPLSDSYNSMLNIRPLTPLEFYASTPVYGCGDNNDISLTNFNGELWARGRNHFGRCYILPAVFAENGSPLEFYLYISPDYNVSPYISATSVVTRAEWLKLSILHTGRHVYGFLAGLSSSLDNNLCYQQDNTKIFVPESNQWLQLAENETMFCDTLNNTGLILQQEGAIFLSGDNPSLNCNGLQQWLAPAGKVDAITPDLVISSWDNATLITHVQQELRRDLLTTKTLHLTAKAYSGKRLSLQREGSVIHVNSMDGATISDTVEWQSIYKLPLEIRAMNFFSQQYSVTLNVPVFISSLSFTSTIAASRYYDPNDGKYHILPSDAVTAGRITVAGIYSWGIDAEGNTSYPAFSYSVDGSGFYIKPDSGTPISFSLSTTFTSRIGIITATDYDPPRDFYDYNGVNTIVDVPYFIGVDNGHLGILYTHYTNGGKNKEYMFRSLFNIPNDVSNWQSNLSGNLALTSIQIPKGIPQNVTCSASAIFREKNSNAKFLCDIPSAFKNTNGNISGTLEDIDNPAFEYFNYWNINSPSEDNSFYTQGLHVAAANYEHFSVFRSELHNEIFDFRAEVERSTLS